MKKHILILIAVSGLTVSCNKGTCNDGEQNQDETAIDCGGECPPCETCTDGIKNQNEVEVDCGGDCAACDIEFPATGTYGTNILDTTEDTVYFSQQHYSLRAVIPEGSTLKIKLNSVTGGSWWYSLGSNVGWSISEFTTGAQFFEGLNTTCELDVDLGNMTGMFQVWYYENSESVTRVRYVYVN